MTRLALLALLTLASCSRISQADWTRQANEGTIALYGVTLEDLGVNAQLERHLHPDPIAYVQQLETSAGLEACLVPQVRGYQCFDRAMDWLRQHPAQEEER